jgi:hypothetical protein
MAVGHPEKSENEATVRKSDIGGLGAWTPEAAVRLA